MTTYHLSLPSEDATKTLAGNLASLAKPGDVIYLSGTLGMGKSTFARAFIQKLAGQKIDVPSPTFTLVQTYDDFATPVWHLDLYRLKDPEEIYELGIEEALADSIILIEWPERLQGLNLAPALEITLLQGNCEAERQLDFTPPSSWENRLERLEDLL